MDVIVALDQGTSSTRAFAFDLQGHCLAQAQLLIEQHYPDDGFVEHSPTEIFDKSVQVLEMVIDKVRIQNFNVRCLGITNQRETTVVWHKKTGQAIYNAIVWQDRRTSELCQSLSHHKQQIHNKTGLIIDPYFSATKLQWILEHCQEAKLLAEKGELAFGTIDSYLIWRLTNGQSHVTDVTNASRTMLYNINEFVWDDELLALFNIPKQLLPQVLNCDAHFGVIAQEHFGLSIPITGVAGDQQAALIGQQCFNDSNAKMTFGTGAFLMINTGKQQKQSEHVLTTIAYKINHQTVYALEGSIFNAGTIIKWLRDNLGVLEDAKSSGVIASQLQDNGDVYLVPAFTGLGAPYWQSNVKAMFTGLQLDSKKAHLIRAGLEAIAYQSYDLVQTILTELNLSIDKLYVDGGMSSNQWLMQFIADLCQLSLVKPKNTESTVLGAAMLAALGAGLYKSFDEFNHWFEADWLLKPKETKELEYLGWKNAIESCIKYS